jgi:type II secretory pathway pseudopilin PulG
MASKDSNGNDLNDKPDNGEDNFGLPDIEYKPLDQPGAATKSDEVAPPEPPPTFTTDSGGGGSYADPASDTADEPKSKAPVVLGIVIVLVVLLAGYLIYNFVYKPAQVEKAKQEQLAKEAAALKKQQEEEARLAKQREEEERKRQEELAKTPPAGTIESLTGRTGRYYVVVSSDIDDDLLMDYAKKLSAKGLSTKIIPPFGDKKFYRLSIADFDSFATAQTQADASKADYSSAVWVIKY